MLVSSETKKQMLLMIAAAAPGERVSSKELASAFGIEDAEANPITRAAIKDAMREFGVPMGIAIGADNSGYFPLRTQDAVMDQIRSLEGRIQGIRDRIFLIKEAWKNGGGAMQRSLFPTPSEEGGLGDGL